MSADLFAARAAAVVRVALPVPVDSLFDYAVPAEMAEAARPGCRVRVQAGSRKLVGVVVEGSDSEPAGLRPLLEVLDEEPVLPAGLLEVILEVAARVYCPPGIALETALPAGSAPRWTTAYGLSPRGESALASGAAQGPLKTLLSALRGEPVAEAKLRRVAGDPVFAAAQRERLLRRADIDLEARARLRRESWVGIRPGVEADRARALLARSPRQAELFEELLRSGPRPARQVRAEASAARALRELEARELLCFEDREAPRDVLGAAPARDELPELSEDQGQAVQVLTAAVRERRSETFLLHGVTGSGKTEVYLRAIASALAEGRHALVLVPEITLTHQLVHRLRARFGELLAVLHSGLSVSERLEQWQKLRDGRAPIAVGARSALFAPLLDLGVIVIDEEHDSAYKNAEGFRYHARDLAAGRSRVDGCPVILGSATPTLETRYAAEQGEIRRLALPRRIGGRPLPSVQLIDLAKERAAAPRGRKLILSPPLLRGLRRVLNDDGQAIVFLNRRGFATQIACFACGHVERCKNCDISLVYHTPSERLRCHYCDYQIAPPEGCSACGDGEGALLGVGTQRVEEALREAFPEARVGRLDRDTAGRKGATQAILNDLRDHRLDILVGTQMVAKGHDFPGVRLVGVIQADQALHFPDFRAAERCFQLLTQVAGRAGRGDEPGQVLVQTYNPDHYAMKWALSHDYERFYREEIEARRELGYPPFGSLLQLGISSLELDQAEAAAAALAEACLREAAAGVSVLGPAPAPIAKLRGRHRIQLLLKSGDRRELLALAHALRGSVAALPASVRTSFDFDPVDML